MFAFFLDAKLNHSDSWKMYFLYFRWFILNKNSCRKKCNVQITYAHTHKIEFKLCDSHEL